MTRKIKVWLIFMMLWAGVAHSADVQVGSAVGRPGDAVDIPIVFSSSPGPPPTIASFTVTLSLDDNFSTPTVAAGADQPNVNAFVDVIDGNFRVTGLIFSGTNIGDGEIVRLTFTIPPVLASGDYPTSTSALQVLDTSNTEVPSTAYNGTITVNTDPTVTPTGSVTPSQGGPSAISDVATVSDAEDPDGSLVVGISGEPSGLTVTVNNTAGTVSATATADCTVTPNTYSVTLTTTDSLGFSDSADFNVIVTANPSPTLGTYTDVEVIGGNGTSVTPTAAPADANDNITTVDVNPTSLPGGGTVSVNAVTGEVTINTEVTTTLGDHLIAVTVTDSCGATAVQDFTLTVTSPPTATTIGSVTTIQGGPTTTDDVATVSDTEDAAGSLGVSVSGEPVGLTVTVNNVGGTVSASATADCALTTGTYTVTLTVTDSDSQTDTTDFDITVTANPAPTLGAYTNTSIVAGNTDSILPSAAPADANANITAVDVNLTSLPGGGTVSVNAVTGEVTMNTEVTTTLGDHLIAVTVTDSCGATAVQDFTLTVTGPPTATTIGSVTTIQGGPTTTDDVATVSDTEDAAGSLGVSVSGEPVGLTVTVNNVGGTVSASATADCALTTGTYTVTLTVTDSELLTDTTDFDIIVMVNPIPTLGSYSNKTVVRGNSTSVIPDAGPADTNNNIDTVTVTPPNLTGGGTVSVDPVTGEVSITTVSGTGLGDQTITVTVTDTCGATAIQSFTLTVLSGIPGDENNDGFVDFGELTATILAYRILGPVPPTADVSGDGLISLGEMTTVLLYYRGIL